MERLDATGVKKLYIRFFDITLDKSSGQPLPVSLTTISNAVAKKYDIVPVIFITNESIRQLDSSKIITLAFKMSKLIEDLLEKNKLSQPAEIQIDCDWTGQTRANYFLLLNELKKYPGWKNCKWSATIRLHQIKFREETGVPPVDRGALMFYNMGKVDEYQEANSIYTKEAAMQYLDRINDYPLPLDAAIACYSWGLLFENEKLIKIFYPLVDDDLPDSLFEKRSEQFFVAKQNFYFEGQFLVAGDEIKIESISPAMAVEAATTLSAHLENEPRSVILYQLDSVVLNQYTNEEFENIFNCFN